MAIGRIAKIQDKISVESCWIFQRHPHPTFKRHLAGGFSEFETSYVTKRGQVEPFSMELCSYEILLESPGDFGSIAGFSSLVNWRLARPAQGAPDWAASSDLELL